MGKNILLSICIPTYNREEYLKECLDSIISQEGFNENDIEIVISDNASTDKTKETIENYQKKHKNIHYYRNKENIGGDRNILKALQMGNGKYVWGISDDDIINTNGLHETIKDINKHKPDIILNNKGYFYNEDQKKKLLNQAKKPTQEKIFYNFYEFTKYLSKSNIVSPYFSFFSILCFRKNFFEESFNKIKQKNTKENYIISRYLFSKNKIHSFGHTYVLYSNTPENTRIVINTNQLTLARMNNGSRIPNLKIRYDLSEIFYVLIKKHHIYYKFIIPAIKISGWRLMAGCFGPIGKKFPGFKKILKKILKL